VQVSIPGDTGRRMVEMGVTSGSMIEVGRIAPLRYPIVIEGALPSLYCLAVGMDVFLKKR
jgi:Fe2+ transport system protein FeoA